jgi:hypothetical protein
MLKLTLPSGKTVRLNPYKRLARGTEVTVTVDGEELIAVVDNAGKYSYLNVGGVDCYVNAALEDGDECSTTEVVPAPAPVQDGEGKPKKRGRKPKAKPEEVVDADE